METTTEARRERIGRVIRERREQRDMSQQTLAERVGSSQGTVCGIERGQVTRLDTLEKVAAEVGLAIVAVPAHDVAA